MTVIGILDPAELGLEQEASAYVEVEQVSPSSASGYARVSGGPGPVARVLLSGLKVLVVPQDFRYEEVDTSGLMPVTTRRDESVVVLEAPVTPITVTVTAQDSMTNTLLVSPVELLALMDARGRVYLALEPLEGGIAASVGLAAADVLDAALHAPPVVPTPTPSPMPTRRVRRNVTPTPTPTPEANEAKGG